MNTRNLVIITAIICATLILIGILFWPTLYRYDTITLGGNALPVRTHRLTGYTEVFMGKWIPQGDKQRKMSTILPNDEKSKVTGYANLSYGSFNGKVYNGSNWVITDMIIRVIAKEKDGSVRWDRKFKETKVILPLSTAGIYISVIGGENVDSIKWSIDEIRGYKEN